MPHISIRSTCYLPIIALLAALTLASGCQSTHSVAQAPTPASHQAGDNAGDSPGQDEREIAALVNGQPIYYDDFLRALTRAEAGYTRQGLAVPGDREQFEAEVLDGMIEDELIRQAAEAQGITISDDEIEAEIQAIIEEAGGPEGWASWLEEEMLTPEELREQIRIQLLGSRMVSQVVAGVPETAEQVHARHILVADEGLAQAILAQLNEGADFAEMARQYSQDTSTSDAGGDLGWFPRGQLLQTEVEDAAFSMRPGDPPRIVTSRLGYHIVQTLDYDPQRPLDSRVRETMIQMAIERWRQGLWDGATIQRCVGYGSSPCN